VELCIRFAPQKVLNPIFGEMQMAAETSTPAASTAPTTAPTPDAASVTWVVVKTYGPPPVRQPGGLATALLFRTRGEITAITAQSNAIGRAGVQQKVREALDPAEPKVARYLKLQAEAAMLARDSALAAAKLTTAKASRTETLLIAAPGFSHQIAQLDNQIADLSGPAAKLAAATAAIAEAVASARREALAVIAAVDATVHNREFSGLCRRREAVIATLPALLSATLTELAIVDRAAQVAMAPSLAAGIEAMLDELAAAPPAVPSEPSPAPAVSSDPPPYTPAEAAPVASAETPEAAPEASAQCEARRKDGQQCNGRSLAGTTRCVLHNPGKRAAAAPAETALVGGS
jgi:hypothetical protein